MFEWLKSKPVAQEAKPAKRKSLFTTHDYDELDTYRVKSIFADTLSAIYRDQDRPPAAPLQRRAHDGLDRSTLSVFSSAPHARDSSLHGNGDDGCVDPWRHSTPLGLLRRGAPLGFAARRLRALGLGALCSTRRTLGLR